MTAACLDLAADPDAELAQALADDVDRGFEALVLAYRVRIVSFVARMLRDDARAEDVAQDVFVRAYRALHGYPPERRASLRLRSWLFAIAHNLTRNVARDNGPTAAALAYDDGTPRDLPDDPRREPEQAVLRAARWAALTAAIARLSPALRAAFTLRYVDEFSYDEIAAVLDQPVGTVKSSAHRGLLAVRAYVESTDD